MQGITDADLRDRFTYHAPTPETIPLFEEIRASGLTMARAVLNRTKPGREQSLAITKIEEAVMHANAALARNGAPDVPFHDHEHKFDTVGPGKHIQHTFCTVDGCTQRRPEAI